jgi:hypothetical protein
MLLLCAILGVPGCQSSPEPPPRPPARPRAAEPDPLGDEVPRTAQTVLEALWDLEKAGREKDRRIAELEAELARVREELERLRGKEDRGEKDRRGKGSKEQKDQRSRN